MDLKTIMTKNIITIQKNDSIKTASFLMLKNEIGFLPVLENDTLIGVITDRDIVIKGCTTLNVENKVQSIISNKVVTIDINKNINDCLKIMQEEKISRLIITSENQIVGIISLFDLLKIEKLETEIIKTLKIIKENKINNKEPLPSIDDFEL